MTRVPARAPAPGDEPPLSRGELEALEARVQDWVLAQFVRWCKNDRSRMTRSNWNTFFAEVVEPESQDS